MSLACSNLEGMIQALPLVRSCEVANSGALRMATPFMYPNGEYVDLFLEDQQTLLGNYQLSDYGQTSLYLRSASVFVNSTSRKKEIIGDILAQLDVRFADHLYINLGSEDLGDISGAILRLSQACVRISDIATHQRLRSSNPFRDDVEDFLDGANFLYSPDYRVVGPYGKGVRLDFEVRSDGNFSYVNILGALSESAAHASANEISLKWQDLAEVGQGSTHRFVTVYNSQSAAMREDDLARLRAKSDLVSYPAENDFLASLLAGDEALKG